MEMMPPTATYSKYDELLEVKVAAIVVLLELCIRFFASIRVWKPLFPYKHSVPGWSNNMKWDEHLMNSGRDWGDTTLSVQP